MKTFADMWQVYIGLVAVRQVNLYQTNAIILHDQTTDNLCLESLPFVAANVSLAFNIDQPQISQRDTILNCAYMLIRF